MHRENPHLVKLPSAPLDSPVRVALCEDPNIYARPTMEDAHLVAFNLAGVPGQHLFAIFDGHCSRMIADWLAGNFARLLEEIQAESPSMPIPEQLELAHARADDHLYQRYLQDHARSGSTTVMCLLRREWNEAEGREMLRLYSANAGDSRAVLYEPALPEAKPRGTVTRLSLDHKPTDPEEETRIKAAGGNCHFGRVSGTLNDII